MFRGQYEAGDELQPTTKATGATRFKDPDGNILPWRHLFQFARGLDMLVGAYNDLDLVPKGRDEDGLAFTMAWVRHHDRYVNRYRVDSSAPYSPPKGSAARAQAREDHS
jgi:predicted dithiol-disulfide oxidoreductase (DUF899 family)